MEPIPRGPDEYEELQRRLEEAEETLRAIRSGEVDALVVESNGGGQVFVLESADRSYRTFVEEMQQGALTLSEKGTILYANRRLTEILGTPAGVIGASLHDFVSPEHRNPLREMLEQALTSRVQEELVLRDPTGRLVPVYFSAGTFHDIPGVLQCIVTDLSEQKRQERVLAAANLAASIFDQSIDAILMCNPHGRILRVSRAAQALCGGDAVGQILGSVILLQHSDGSPVSIEPVLQGTLIRLTDARLVRPNAETLHVLLSAGPLRDASHEICGFLLTLTDITQIHKREQELRESEARYRILSETVPFGSWMADSEGKPTYLAPSYLDMLGMTLDESRESLPERFQPAERGRLTSRWEECVRNGGHWDEEFAIRGRNGEYRTVLSKGIPIRDRSGRITAWVGANVDVTERQRLERTLRENDERLRLALEAASLGVWDWDLRSGGVYWSAEQERTYGLMAGSFPGTRSAWMELVHPEDRAAVNAQARDAVVSGGDYSVLYRIVRPDRTSRWIQSIGRILEFDDGAPTKMIGICLDVTEAKMAEEGAREDARRKDEFLAMLAHELRNPLAPILYAVHILKAADANPALRHEVLGVIQNQVDQLTHLVDDLLDVSRITRGKINLSKSVIDLGGPVLQAVDTVQPEVQRRKQNLTVELPPEPIFVEADATRLSQVVGNLLNNAAKYTQEHGRIVLTVERCEEGTGEAEAVIRVRDNGIGIAAEFLPFVFDPFVQGDTSLARSGGGLGIGLSLVRLLSEMHGGRAEAFSEGGDKGSEFVIHIPLARTAPQISHGDADAPACPSPLRGRRVLVLEDNREMAAISRSLLDLAGSDVRMAHGGVEALELAADFRPEIVLLDIGLPGINGYEAAERLRKLPGMENAILVALTGYGQDKDRRRSFEAGIDAHLVKPVKYENLVSTIDSIVRNRRAQASTR